MMKSSSGEPTATSGQSSYSSSGVANRKILAWDGLARLILNSMDLLLPTHRSTNQDSPSGSSFVYYSALPTSSEDSSRSAIQ